MQQLMNSIKLTQENQEIAKSIANIANVEENIVIDFKDIQQALKSASVADAQKAQESGDDAIPKAMQKVVSKLNSLENIVSVFVRFDMHPDVSLIELVGAMDILDNKLDENAEVVFGTVCDKSLDKLYAKVSVLSFYK